MTSTIHNTNAVVATAAAVAVVRAAAAEDCAGEGVDIMASDGWD